MGDHIGFKVPSSIKEEFYEAVFNAQARLGRKILFKELGVTALIFLIKLLNGELPKSCLAQLEKDPRISQILSQLVDTKEVIIE